MFGLFWIIIGVAIVVLLMLVVLLLAEIGKNRQYKLQQKQDYAPKKKPKKSGRGTPRPAPQPESSSLEAEAERAEAITAPPAFEEVLEDAAVAPEETAAAEIEAPEPEASVETVAESAEEAVTGADLEPMVYPDFDNSRAVEQLGLSQEEADMFIPELIGQIEEELPNLHAAIEADDVAQVERVSHMLKGSATNLGTGGVSDVLVDFNTYCKTGTDLDTIRKHMNNLRFHLDRLKEQFPD